MTNNNNQINNYVPFKEWTPNIPKTATIFYFNEAEWNKDLTAEEITKREELAELEYQDRVLHGPQYGPGNEKEKRKKYKEDGDELNSQHLIHTLNNKIGSDRFDWWSTDHSVGEENGWKALNFATSAGASAGAGGMIAGGNIGGSSFTYTTSDGEVEAKFGNLSLGGEIGGGLGGVTAGYNAGYDLANVHTAAGVRANLGVDVGSNFTAGAGGVEVKAAGFGVSVGKKIGVSTPVGGVSIDLEETCDMQ